MGAVFPELRTRGEMVAQVLHAEEESFNATLDRGLELFDEIVARTKKTIAGDDAFKLYDTFGFPIDLTNILAAERGLSVDMHRFEVLLNEQKTRSKKVHESKKHHEIAAEELEGVATEFIGYDVFQASSKVIYANGDMVILDQTPFYAESGGQISDIGTLTMNGITYHVIDTRKTAGGKAIAHYVDNDDTAELLGISAASRIDVERRFDIMRNHTATHLVHSALRKILGEHVHQAGSLVSENNLRFDFSHFQRVDDEQLRDIEALVNDKIREAIGLVHHRSIPFDDAKKMGALMFFGDKYGDRVNVVDFGPFSREFCGGTHVKNTSEIGLFKLVSESSIASGTRRIEAVTGKGVEKWINDKLSVIDELSREREKLEDDKRKLEKELAKLRLSARASEAQQIADSVVPFKNTAISYSAKLIKASSSDEFKSFAEMVQSSLHPGSVILLGAAVDDKASLIAMVSDDLVKEKKLSAGKIVSAAAEIVGGKGGGKPNFAQAGGKNPENLQRAVNNLPVILNTMMAS
jgi:alanyl-tRNA synthetase